MRSSNLASFIFTAFFLAPWCSAQNFDFFLAFDSTEVCNQDAFAIFEPGESGSVYIYYSTNGPSDSNLNMGAFLDIQVLGENLRITHAETFDFPYLVSGGIEVGNRWTAYGATGTINETGTFVNELGAFQMQLGDGILEENNGSGIFLDAGYNVDADAFLFGRIDFEVFADGDSDIVMSAGSGLVLNSENPDGTCVGPPLRPSFGIANIVTPLPGPEGGGGTGGPPNGDVNGDGATDLLDVAPFVQLLVDGGYRFDADINEDGEVTLLDVQPFIDLLLNGCTGKNCDPILGDVNCDGVVNLLDVSCLRVLLINGGEPCDLATSDIDGDGQIDLLDVIPMIDIMLEQE